MLRNLTILSFLVFHMLQIMAQDQYYFVFLNTNPDRDDISKDSIAVLQKLHLSNIDSLYKAEKLVAAGPFETGGGIFILVAPTLDSANNMLKTDPAIMAKRFITEVYPFTFHKGSICKASEPFEMTTYHFVRYHKGVVPIDQEVFENHYTDHLQLYDNDRDSVVMDGSFSLADGFVQVINIRDSQKVKNMILLDSLVSQNYYYTELKKLWIAKGTFCEQ